MMVDELNDLRKDVQEYIGVKLDVIRLHMAENLSRIFSNVATAAVTGYLLFLVIMFISFAAGFFIGHQLNSNELGFLCVAGFYLLLLLIFLAFRKHIVEKPVIRTVMKLLFPNFEDDEKK
jgi:hypothetical protein